MNPSTAQPMKLNAPLWRARSVLKAMVGSVLSAYKISVSRIIAWLSARDRRTFYGIYFASPDRLPVLLRNLAAPDRFWVKARYGQIAAMPYLLRKSEPLPQKLGLDPALEERVQHSVSVLKRDGILILDGYFTDVAREAERTYKVMRSDYQPGLLYLWRHLDPRSNWISARLSLDPFLLSVVGRYYGCQPYVRNESYLTVCYPEFSYDDFRKGQSASGREFKHMGRTDNCNWHYDTPNQLTTHTLLSDITASDTHMLYAKGSHQLPHQYLRTNFDYFYSEELVRDRFDIIQCTGRAGTAILFDSNGLHRMNPITDTFRSHFHTHYTPGNDILDLGSAASRSSVVPNREGARDPAPPDISAMSDLQQRAIAKLPQHTL